MKTLFIITPNQEVVLAHALADNKLFLGCISADPSITPSITIWDAATGDPMGSLEGDTVPLLSDEKKLVFLSSHSSINILNLEDNTCSTFAKPLDLDLLFSFYFMAKGKLFVCKENQIQIWKVESKSITLLSEWKGHDEKICSMNVAGELFFSGSHDGTVRMWDLNALKQEPIQQPPCTSTFCVEEDDVPFGLAISHGKLFACSNKNTFYTWDIKTQERNIFRYGSQTVPTVKAVKAGKLFCEVKDGIQVLDFTADYSEVFEEIANLFDEAERTPYLSCFGGLEDIYFYEIEDEKLSFSGSKAMDRFSRMPESAQQEVFKELGQILNYSVEDAEIAWGSTSTPAQKAQAIRNYIQNSRSQQG